MTRWTRLGGVSSTYRSAVVGGSALVLGGGVHNDVVVVVVWVDVGIELGLVGLSWIKLS